MLVPSAICSARAAKGLGTLKKNYIALYQVLHNYSIRKVLDKPLHLFVSVLNSVSNIQCVQCISADKIQHCLKEAITTSVIYIICTGEGISNFFLGFGWFFAQLWSTCEFWIYNEQNFWTLTKRRILSHRPRYPVIMVITKKLLSNIRSLEVLILLLL